MRLCIHRGSKEIGGSCVELDQDGYRILLDIGLPLDIEFDEAALPPVKGLREPDPSLLGIVLSHSHRDHWGLLPKIKHPIDVHLGRRALAVMRAAAPFMPVGYAPAPSITYEDREPFVSGPFRVTPYLTDHSGFDAYCLLIESGGKRLFYSGDLRAHGRKAKLFERLVAQPPEFIDVMLMEGSSLGRLEGRSRFETEGQIEQRLVDAIGRTQGMLLVACSVQNIDRVVSVYRAARQSGRQLIVDAYGGEVLRATGTSTIPKPADDWEDVKVYIPQSQRRMLVRNQIAPIVDAYKGRRIFPEMLPAVAGKSVMIVRPWMLNDLDRGGALVGARAIWSQWEGYLTREPGIKFSANCRELGIPTETIHTSGHADIHSLKRFATALSPKRLIPIHTFFPDRFGSLFDNVTPAVDGQWEQI
ncbi:MBL fold metallo-hydrolase [Mesorhizobium sp. WSM3879]|uniref:MBL fold metallo-hydrolase n=1 Tax=Mesorhizobium sp. WSM3879 TaxID=2029406 RepID=UPI000BAFEBA4|nr:MBL fold metallo-hydrolase [Mesorhizobium sp. WSM3879]PBB81239.1 MBL fold metallo-hydrolase [Mesorhizobium sp. WSM3879]